MPEKFDNFYDAMKRAAEKGGASSGSEKIDAKKDAITRRSVEQLIDQINRLQQYINNYRDTQTGLSHFQASAQVDKYATSKLQLGKLKSELERYKDKELNDEDVEHFATIRERLVGFITEFKKDAKDFEVEVPDTEPVATTTDVPTETAAVDAQPEEKESNQDVSDTIKGYTQRNRNLIYSLQHQLRSNAPDAENRAYIEKSLAELRTFQEFLDSLKEDPTALTEEIKQDIEKHLTAADEEIRTGMLKKQASPSPDKEPNTQEQGQERNFSAIRNQVQQIQEEMQKGIDANPDLIKHPVFEAYTKSLTELHNYLYDQTVAEQHRERIEQLLTELEAYTQQLLEGATQEPTEPIPQAPQQVPNVEAGSIEESLQQQFGFQDDRLKRLEEQYGSKVVRRTGDYMAIDGVKLKLEHHFKKVNTPEFDIARVQELLASNSANIGVLQKRLEREHGGATFESRLALKNEHRQKKTAYEDAYKKYIQNGKDKNVIQKLQFWKKDEKPKELLDAEGAYQTARSAYEHALFNALSKRRLSDENLETAINRLRGYRAGMANRFVLGAVIDKLAIEKEVLTPDFSEKAGDGKVGRTFKNLQSFFQKRKKTMRVVGWGWTVGGAVVTGGIAGIAPALLGRTAGTAIIGVSTASGAALGGAVGRLGVTRAEGVRDKGIARTQAEYKPVNTLALEAELEKNYKRVEQAGKNQKKWVAAGALGGATLGALATNNLEEAIDAVTTSPDATPTVQPNEAPQGPYHQTPPQTTPGQWETEVPPVSVEEEMEGPPMPPETGASQQSIPPLPEDFPPMEGENYVIETEAPQQEPETVQTREVGSAGPDSAIPDSTRIDEGVNMPNDARVSVEAPPEGVESELVGGIIGTPIEHTISESETVHDALVTAWKENQELINSDITVEELHERLKQLINNLENNPRINEALMGEAQISSGDINLVYPKETINLEPFFRYLNLRYYP